jgi:succinate dehydrogenase/fumarate reductase flavoprotein subunit
MGTTYEADVIVVGYGGAGATVAVEAYEQGSSVIVLERGRTGGGSTRESGGSIRVIEDRSAAVAHFLELCEGTTPPAVIDTFVGALAEVPQWISSHGGTYVPLGTDVLGVDEFPLIVAGGTAFPRVEGASGVGGRLQVLFDGGRLSRGEGLFGFLSQLVADREIPVHFETRATRLSRSQDGERIVGVDATCGSEDVHYVARQGVVLSCGGFAFDPGMQRDYLGADFPAISVPGAASGDGVRMAAAAGADLWHMNAAAATVGYKIPGHDAAFWTRLRAPSFIVVDQRSRRYINEWSIERHSAAHAMLVLDLDEARYLRMPSFVIMDSAVVNAGPIADLVSGYNRRLSWSRDNQAEIDRGWIQQADSIEELGTRLGLPETELAATVDAYNAGAKAGTDAFRRQHRYLAALTGPPYYGIPVWPALLNTQGGPRKNEHGQVLSPFGKPIEGLYCAGELGSIWGRLYPGSGNVSECIALGRVTGAHVARLERQDRS